MRRIVAITVGSLFLISLIVPWAIGLVISHEYHQKIQRYNAAGLVKIDLQHYERHWYTTTAQLSVKVPPEAVSNLFAKNNKHLPNDISFDLAQTIYHGPLFFKKANGWPFAFGLAEIETKVSFSKAALFLLRQLGIQALAGSQAITYLESIGNDAIEVNANTFQWNTDSGISLLFSDLDTEASLNQVEQHLVFNQNLSARQLYIAHEEAGPLAVMLSVTGLNGMVINDIINAYQKVLRTGEDYQDQLNTKLSLLLPKIFEPGAAITLHSFSLMTPNGVLQAQGTLKWPIRMGEPPAHLAELWEEGVADFSIRFPKKLIDKIIDLSIEFYFMKTLTNEERFKLMTLQDDVNKAFQLNAIFQEELFYEGLLTKEESTELFGLQKEIDDAPLYLEMVKSLFLDKRISRETAYRLYLQYEALLHSANQLEITWFGHKSKMKQNLMNQFNAWVKHGYVQAGQADYFIHYTRDQGVVKMNGLIMTTQSH